MLTKDKVEGLTSRQCKERIISTKIFRKLPRKKEDVINQADWVD